MCKGFYAGVRAQVAAVEKPSTEEARNVESPVVVVTGASRGIGRAIALSFGKAGCKVGGYFHFLSSLSKIPVRISFAYHCHCLLSF